MSTKAADTVGISVAEGVELAADVWPGEGAPFVLLHGLASNRRLWHGTAHLLAAEGHAVATLDLRGHGESARPSSGYAFETMTADVVAACSELGFERPVVAGQSYGGNLVLELADRYPGAVRGVAAVDGGILDIASRFRSWDECVAALSPPKLEMSVAELRSYFSSLMSQWPPGSVEAAMACFEEDPSGRPRARLTLENHLSILRSMWEHRPAELLERTQVPTLLLPCDTGDAAWTEHKRSTLASLRHDGATPVRVHWFEAHHDVHLQRPAEVAGALLSAVSDGFFG